MMPASRATSAECDEHVLAVAGAVLEAAHQPEDLRMQIVQAELEGHRRAFLAHRLVGLVLHLLDDFFDARRVDAAVGDQPLDRLLGDLAAIRIEARQDDRARRVVDDQIDAGGELERADVASLAADDAPLEIVARQIDDRDGRFDRVLGGAALDGLGDVLLGAVDGRFARLGVEPLQQVGRVVARVAFDLLEQQLLGFVGGQARRRARARAAAAATSCSYFAAAAAALLSRARATRALARRAAPSRAARSRPGARRAPRRGGPASARASPPAGAPARAWRSASIRISCAFSLASSSASFLRVSASRSASLARRSACSSARPMVSAAMRLRLATQTANTAPADDDGDDGGDDDSPNIDNTRDVLSRDPSCGVDAAREESRSTRSLEGCESEKPRFAVWGGR